MLVGVGDKVNLVSVSDNVNLVANKSYKGRQIIENPLEINMLLIVICLYSVYLIFKVFLLSNVSLKRFIFTLLYNIIQYIYF